MREEERTGTREEVAGAIKRRTFLVATCVLLSLFALDSRAADWIKLGPTRERGETYYDRESVRMQDKIAEVWVRRALADGSPWFLFRIDCSASTFRVSGSLPGPGAGIAPKEDPNDKPATWEPIYPGSTADGIWDGVCRSKKKK